MRPTEEKSLTPSTKMISLILLFAIFITIGCWLIFNKTSNNKPPSDRIPITDMPIQGPVKAYWSRSNKSLVFVVQGRLKKAYELHVYGPSFGTNALLLQTVYANNLPTVEFNIPGNQATFIMQNSNKFNIRERDYDAAEVN